MGAIPTHYTSFPHTNVWAPPHLIFCVTEIAKSARRTTEGVEDLLMTHTADQQVLHRLSS